MRAKIDELIERIEGFETFHYSGLNFFRFKQKILDALREGVLARTLQRGQSEECAKAVQDLKEARAEVERLRKGIANE